MHTTLLDSPTIREHYGHPMWLAQLAIGPFTVTGRSRYCWLARLKAVVNHAAYIACGRRDSSRLWWRLRW